MIWFWERSSGGRARDLTILLLLVCKTIDKITITLFFLVQKEGGAMTSISPLLATSQLKADSKSTAGIKNVHRT